MQFALTGPRAAASLRLPQSPTTAPRLASRRQPTRARWWSLTGPAAGQLKRAISPRRQRARPPEQVIVSPFPSVRHRLPCPIRPRHRPCRRRHRTLRGSACDRSRQSRRRAVIHRSSLRVVWAAPSRLGRKSRPPRRNLPAWPGPPSAGWRWRLRGPRPATWWQRRRDRHSGHNCPPGGFVVEIGRAFVRTVHGAAQVLAPEQEIDGVVTDGGVGLDPVDLFQAFDQHPPCLGFVNGARDVEGPVGDDAGGGDAGLPLSRRGRRRRNRPGYRRAVGRTPCAAFHRRSGCRNRRPRSADRACGRRVKRTWRLMRRIGGGRDPGIDRGFQDFGGTSNRAVTAGLSTRGAPLAREDPSARVRAHRFQIEPPRIGVFVQLVNREHPAVHHPPRPRGQAVGRRPRPPPPRD